MTKIARAVPNIASAGAGCTTAGSPQLQRMADSYRSEDQARADRWQANVARVVRMYRNECRDAENAAKIGKRQMQTIHEENAAALAALMAEVGEEV